MAIPIKNAEGIRRMRAACAIAAAILAKLKAEVRPGLTTYDLDQIGRDLIAAHGARSACHGYRLPGHPAYPAYTCLSVNEEVVHGIGSLKRVLREGDILSLDVVIDHDGWIGDNATTVAVGALAPRTAELLRVTAEALDLGIQQAQVGHRIGDISAAVQRHVEAHGFSVVRAMVGHGVGRSMHEEPQIPNFVDQKRSRTDEIRPGMTLAIEPMVNLGRAAVRTLPDGWTVVTADGSPSAHFEHTVLTTEAGPEILTRPPAPSPLSSVSKLSTSQP